MEFVSPRLEGNIIEVDISSNFNQSKAQFESLLCQKIVSFRWFSRSCGPMFVSGNSFAKVDKKQGTAEFTAHLLR